MLRCALHDVIIFCMTLKYSAGWLPLPQRQHHGYGAGPQAHAAQQRVQGLAVPVVGGKLKPVEEQQKTAL